MATLRLGDADMGALGNVSGLLRDVHEGPMGTNRFRNEEVGSWRAAAEKHRDEIAGLQASLRDFGFYPKGNIDGLFGYRTLSAVRLFQEYIRTVESIASIGSADGVVGPNTTSHIQRWLSQGKVADWKSVSSANPTPAYTHWHGLLQATKDHFSRSPDATRAAVTRANVKCDSLAVTDWDYSPNHTHLIGIRRRAEVAPGIGKSRRNNDVFVLLVDGLAFVFFGSTDPNPSAVSRSGEPYIVPGQHLYRFGWHKISDTSKVYRAFRPANRGVLCVRDTSGGTTDALDDTDIEFGLDVHPNPTINIHWSGRQTSNWSAGCQVISGGGYINHKNEAVDCWDLAANTYSQLSSKQTRAAYNVFLDLVTVFANDISIRDGDRLRYSLINEDDLRLSPNLGPRAALDLIVRGAEIVRRHAPDLLYDFDEALG